MIATDGWHKHNIWEHSASVRQLYRQRCLLQAEEMTAHAQAAEIIAEHARPHDELLDVGCGSGYFFHALQKRVPQIEYWGLDASAALIGIGQDVLSGFGLPSERLQCLRIEDAAGDFDHVVCINVLSNIDNYHRPLERMLRMAKKTVVLRESLKHGAEYHYVRDNFLDPGVDLNVHVNHYDLDDVMSFIQRYGFAVRYVQDRRTRGAPESVIGHLHYWGFLVATRLTAK